MSEQMRTSLQKRFQDFRNYPYGFSRSGDFSLKESQVLEQYGRLAAALADDLITPETEEEKRLQAVIRSELEPESALERVWMKYQKRINRPHVRALSAKSPSTEGDDDEDVIIDDDED
ncbi:DUF413 domain-containing protein [Neiella marina]|uniref:Macrodomain Ori protein n=1 Tax=Neiella holothuriorum TaxID=2870530 RepID=A0ABS7EH57_9GAMM|nr:DUF413 domain-containing protein [Neiella holothuriorum]MBW8191017.1 DUF413 domain-containing protein [Neiella holothuriorum]